MQDHMPPRRLTRSADRKIGGVCGGLAEYFGIDPTLMRVGFVLLSIFTLGPGGLVAYGVLWAIMPAPDPNAPTTSSTGSGSGGNTALLLGIILVLLGVAMAVQGLQLLWWMASGLFRLGVPAMLVIAGVFFVIASRRR